MNDKDIVQDEKIVGSDTAKRKIFTAKQKLLHRSPKFSWIFKSVKIIDGGASTSGGRGCTDGRDNIWLNAGMDEEELVDIMEHEAKHIERKDCDKDVEDFELWNIATDAVINNEMENEGKYIRNGVRIAGAASMGAEKLYKNLLTQKKGLKEEPRYEQAI